MLGCLFLGGVGAEGGIETEKTESINPSFVFSDLLSWGNMTNSAQLLRYLAQVRQRSRVRNSHA